MAKQRRTHQKSATRKAGRKPTVAKPEPVPALARSLVEPRASYVEAIALYERGLEALQRHEIPRSGRDAPPRGGAVP